MGFGFVEFKSEEDAAYAIKARGLDTVLGRKLSGFWNGRSLLCEMRSKYWKGALRFMTALCAGKSGLGLGKDGLIFGASRPFLEKAVRSEKMRSSAVFSKSGWAPVWREWRLEDMSGAGLLCGRHVGRDQFPRERSLSRELFKTSCSGSRPKSCESSSRPIRREKNPGCILDGSVRVLFVTARGASRNELIRAARKQDGQRSMTDYEGMVVCVRAGGVYASVHVRVRLCMCVGAHTRARACVYTHPCAGACACCPPAPSVRAYVRALASVCMHCAGVRQQTLRPLGCCAQTHT
eukprot:6199267-Pleurochrysis_carterae.AAC.1